MGLFQCLQGQGMIVAGGGSGTEYTRTATAPANAKTCWKLFTSSRESHNDQTNYLINPLSITPRSATLPGGIINAELADN